MKVITGWSWERGDENPVVYFNNEGQPSESFGIVPDIESLDGLSDAVRSRLSGNKPVREIAELERFELECLLIELAILAAPHSGSVTIPTWIHDGSGAIEDARVSKDDRGQMTVTLIPIR